MASRIGLIRARGRAHGANLVYGQHQLCGLVSCAGRSSGSSLQSTIIPVHPSTNNSRLRLLARLSSSSRADVGRVDSNRMRHEAAGGVVASACRNSASPSFLRNDPLSDKAALFSSNAKPSRDEEGDEGLEGDEDEAGEDSDYNAMLEGIGGETKEDRLARLDDGDKVWACYCWVVNLCWLCRCQSCVEQKICACYVG